MYGKSEEFKLIIKLRKEDGTELSKKKFTIVDVAKRKTDKRKKERRLLD
jgi:hypothetical protein